MTDEDASGGGRLFRRDALAVLAVLGLVLLVALAASGGAPGVGDDAPRGDAPTFLRDYIGTLAVLLVPIGAVLVVYALVMRRVERARGGGSGKRSVFRTILVTVLAIAAALVVSDAIRDRFQSGPERPGLTEVPAAGEGGGGGESERRRPAEFQWLPAAVLGSLVLAFAVVAATAAERRRLRRPEETAALAAALSDVFDESLDDLRREPDPRKAVIRTYERMERTMAARGVPRHAFEAPLEYLARMLDAVQVGAHSAARLTGLFERARFSSHEIDSGMKDEAIDALVGLRAELEATS
jgi:hypothetical protein